MEFLIPADIANRALDHCGATALDVTLGLSEVSTRAAICNRLYGKLRRAELQRNTWRFAIKRTAIRPIDATTMLLVPALWVSITTYFVGSIVSDSAGTLWISQIPNNLNNQPSTSNTWAEYFGPMTVSPWDTTGTTAYFAGELVYTAAGDGTNRVYLSLLAGNTDNPATATAWSATTTYFKNQTVTRSSVVYQSLIDLNLNQDPALAPALYNAGTTYSAAARVGGSDGVIYQSIAGGNAGHDPTISPIFWTNTGVLNPWTTVFVGGHGSLNWLQIGGAEFPMGVTVAPIPRFYPMGAGPASQSTSANVYRLPAGFLRLVPQDPKGNSGGYQWAPSGHAAKDWLFEGNYLVSWDSTPIVLRFVADTVDVTTFDDMFCEGLGARLGLEICEPVTQSGSKKSVIAGEYARFMGEARTNNAILIGTEDLPEDELILCRL